MAVTDNLTAKSGHLAWCALVALALATRGNTPSAVQEHMFLTQWLATALKQRRFAREVAPDIEWLIKQGRQYGVNANLRSKLDYLWRSCTGNLTEQSDLFRLTYALETAKNMQWAYRPLTETEWAGRHAISLNSNVNGIYLLHSCLDTAFNSEDNQTSPVMARITGSVAGLSEMFARCRWQIAQAENAEVQDLFKLTVISKKCE